MTTARLLAFALLALGAGWLAYVIHATHRALGRLLAYRSGTTQDGDTDHGA